MGGVVADALASVAKPLAEKAVAKIAENKAAIEGAQAIFNKSMRNMGHVFQETKASRMMWEDFNTTYIQNKDQFLQKSLQQSVEMTSATPKTPLNTTPHGPVLPSALIHAQARNFASERTFGRYNAHIAAYVKASRDEVLQKTGSAATAQAHAQTLSDHVAMILHDSMDETKYTKITKKGPVTRVVSPEEAEKIRARGKADRLETTRVSRVKTDIARNKETGVPINTSAVHEEPGPLEHAFTNYLSRTLASAIAIPHLATPLNVLLGTPLGALTRSMVTMATDYSGAKDLLLKTGVLAESATRAMRDLEGFKNGHIVSIEKGTPAYWLNKITNAPGFSGLRKWTTVLAGVTAHHAGAEYAARFAETGDRAAELQLREVYHMDDVDLDDIKRNKGKLSENQQERVIYNGANDKIFLHPELNRSYYSGKNGFTRVGGMFHGYVASQGRLFTREISRAARGGFNGSNLAYVANLAAVLGVAFPFAGAIVTDLEKVSRGDFDNIHPDTQIDNLTLQNGLTPFMEEYIESLAHTAAFGIAFSYIQGATRNSMANSILGPLGNIFTGDIHDIYTAGKGLVDGEDDKWYNLARDLMQQGPVGNRVNIGKFASNMLLPRKHVMTEDEREEKALELGRTYLDPDEREERREFNKEMKGDN